MKENACEEYVGSKSHHVCAMDLCHSHCLALHHHLRLSKEVLIEQTEHTSGTSTNTARSDTYRATRIRLVSPPVYLFDARI